MPPITGRKPLLRWAGSKKRQAQQYAIHFPRGFGRYAEPFAGSASFCFVLGLTGCKLNDVNADLMNFYEHARREPERLWREFAAIPRTPASFYDARAAYNAGAPPWRKAVLFYFINRNCFNGLYRVNRGGDFNVPFSASRVPAYPSLADFVAGAGLLKDFHLTTGDFETFCRTQVDKGDFVFLDPPYTVGGWERFHHYTIDAFTTDDFGRMRRVLDELDRSGAKFMLSFPDHSLLYPLRKWNTATLRIRRTIAGRAAFRGTADEVLVFNYDR